MGNAAKSVSLWASTQNGLLMPWLIVAYALCTMLADHPNTQLTVQTMHCCLRCEAKVRVAALWQTAYWRQFKREDDKSIVLPTFILVLFTLIQGHRGLQKVGGKVLICSCWSWDSINFRLSGCMKKVVHKMLVMALACIYFKECNWCFCLDRSSLQMFKSDKYWAWPPLNITCSWIPV